VKSPAHLLLLLALAAALPAQAQIGGERMLPQPVEPGRVAPWRPASPPAMDPPETGMVREAPTGPTLADWYNSQGRPAVALFFDRRLERLPPGWNGTSRVRFAYEASAGTSQFRDQLTVGVERRTPVASVRSRAPVVVLIEGALLRELQSSRLRLVDPTVAERGLAARDSGGDTEFNSLRNAAGYVLEVEMVPVGDTVSMIGHLKNLRTSELVATVRQPVEHDLRDPSDVDTLARAFVRRLLATPSR
jgi:hypothetical protein